MKRLNSSLLGLVAISAAASNTLSTGTNVTEVTTSRNNIIRRISVGTGSTSIGNINNNNTNISSGKTNLINMTNSDQDRSKKPNDAAQIVKNSDVICFDVDSTVITEEGIDELAKFCGKGNEVARLTREAMKGSMTFQEALRLRLNIIRPSQRQIRDFLKAQPSTLSPGIKDFINTLRLNNIKVYLITGGFDCLIEPVANELGIPLKNMYANKLFFTFNGEYAGFDTTQPTSRSGGKGEAIKLIRQSLTDNAMITMIGDGATDLEASPPADHFIGYGGNIVRDEVHQRAKYYITNFEQLSTSL